MTASESEPRASASGPGIEQHHAVEDLDTAGTITSDSMVRLTLVTVSETIELGLFMRNIPKLRALIFWGSIILGGLPLRADIVTVANQNSTFSLDTSSPAGASSWTVDGHNLLSQQSLFISVNDGSLIPVDGSSLQLTSDSVTGGHSTVSYTGDGYKVTIRYSLVGGSPGSNASDMSEVFSVTNTGSAALSMDFFLYTDMNFSLNGDSVQFLNPSSVLQSAGIYENDTVVSANGLVSHQATSDATLLTSLDSGSAPSLNNSNSAYGNTAWAFEWQKTINAGSTFTMTTDMDTVDPPPPVPEPGSCFLLGTCVLAFGWFARRKSSRSYANLSK